MKHRNVAALGSALVAGSLAAAAFGGVASAAPAANAATCASPKATTVKVSMFEMGFKLVPATPLHCGPVTFKLKNTGGAAHNFNIQGVKSSKLLQPGQSATMKVTLKPGKYAYLCDVLGHAGAGMQGTLKVK